MTEQESKDYTELVEQNDAIRRNAFANMKRHLSMSQEDLKNSGYSTVEEAVVGTFKFAQANLDRALKEYLKKYPD